MMNPSEIEDAFESLRKEVETLSNRGINMGNYKDVLARMFRVTNDMIVLGRELARNCKEKK